MRVLTGVEGREGGKGEGEGRVVVGAAAHLNPGTGSQDGTQNGCMSHELANMTPRPVIDGLEVRPCNLKGTARRCSFSIGEINYDPPW